MHPLDGGRAGVLHRSVATTAAGLGRDGRALAAACSAPGVRQFDALAEDIMGPLLRVPHHPLKLARFGAPTLLPASDVRPAVRTEEARALFGGVAAHAFRPLHYPMTSAIGLGIITAGHRHGWPVAEGGSQSITNALAALLADLGGEIETGVRVAAASELPPADVDHVRPGARRGRADLLGDRLPPRIARAYRRFRHGPAAFKVDFAVEGGVPWTTAHGPPGRHRPPRWRVRRAGRHRARRPRRAPAASARSCWSGSSTWPIRSARSATCTRVYSYAHVPHGFTGDATAAIIAQIERFAPGFRERIVGTAVRSTTEMAAYNPNYVGGDIVTGAKDIRQLTCSGRDHPVAVQHWRAGHVHLLGGDPAGPGCARHVRGQRRRSRAQPPR